MLILIHIFLDKRIQISSFLRGFGFNSLESHEESVVGEM